VIVADSDVLIDALHGAEPARARIGDAVAAGTLAASAITVFELWAGARSRREQETVDALLAALPVLSVDATAARIAAEVERNLRQAGIPIGFADALVAGTCLATDSSLLTRNTRHFGRVPGLRLESLSA
jgi:tRNA(fMet)-specific endonuclease VapC